MTELNSISGKTEYTDYHKPEREVAYKPAQIDLTAIYGGDIRGRCLQLTIDESNIQLTVEQARKLRDEIIRFCDEKY